MIRHCKTANHQAHLILCNMQQGEVTRGALICYAELANRPLQRTVPLCHCIVGGSSGQRSCKDYEHCQARKGANKPQVSHRRSGAKLGLGLESSLRLQQTTRAVGTRACGHACAVYPPRCSSIQDLHAISSQFASSKTIPTQEENRKKHSSNND